MRTFLLIWFGQCISLLGSGLTNFALGVWVYQRTGSVTKFALVAFFSSLPGLVLSPFAGALVDRWNRRATLIFSDGLGAVRTILLALLLGTRGGDLLSIWHIYALSTIASIADAFQVPAFAAATTLLVPKRHFGRASGLSQMGVALTQIVSPFLGGLLLVSLGLRGILLIDLATFAFAVLMLLAFRFGEAVPLPEEGGQVSLWGEAGFGWRYLRQRPGLLMLLGLFAGTNFTLGMLQALLTPLVMSFASAQAVGSVLSIAGLGMLAGTLVMSLWGGPRRRIAGIFGAFLIQGLVLFLGGARASVPLIATAAFLFLFVTPIINGCSQVIWQGKVAPGVQGRVFAVRRMVALSSMPAAYFLAGPLADRIFEPMLAPGGALAGTVGAVLGVGKGRGIAFLFMVLGVCMILGLAVALASPRLRNLEDELPDAVEG